ncbi:unnamed protein product [Pieris macdunnoughi]|uniref:Uncharacterized protein n=1 Tax=Pieris macdunnoughi TaxID=345717 RepID=A0A821NH85_9NEOP|nr:unnamed protein product [Pieris macdunnoughi]
MADQDERGSIIGRRKKILTCLTINLVYDYWPSSGCLKTYAECLGVESGVPHDPWETLVIGREDSFFNEEGYTVCWKK